MLKIGQAAIYRDCGGQTHDALVTHVAGEKCASLIYLEPLTGAAKHRLNVPHGSLCGWKGGNYFGDPGNDVRELVAQAKACLTGEFVSLLQSARGTGEAKGEGLELRQAEGIDETLKRGLLDLVRAAVEGLAPMLGLAVEPKAKPETKVNPKLLVEDSAKA